MSNRKILNIETDEYIVKIYIDNEKTDSICLEYSGCDVDKLNIYLTKDDSIALSAELRELSEKVIHF